MSELYLFEDNGVNYGFTPTIFGKTLNGVNYIPTVVKRTGIHLTDNFSKIPITLQFDRSNQYIKSLTVSIPERPIAVTIFKDGLTYWKGKVLSASVTGGKISIKCDSIITSLERNGLHNKFTLTCRHVLYSADCGVVKSSWESLYTVTASSAVITIPTITEADGYFNNGIAEMEGQVRNILKHGSGGVLTLSLPFTGTLAGTIKLYPGCRLTEANCIAYNNLDNFGGFARTPVKNPFNSTGLL